MPPVVSPSSTRTLTGPRLRSLIGLVSASRNFSFLFKTTLMGSLEDDGGGVGRRAGAGAERMEVGRRGVAVVPGESSSVWDF